MNKPDLNKPVFKVFPEAKKDIESRRCPICHQVVLPNPNSFRDDLSRKEYEISGLCQKCQDNIFGDE